MFHLDWDGHVHSGFCPHGSGEPTRAFIEKAIEIGLKRVSIIEHFPFPPDFPPPPTINPVSMEMDKVEPYLDETNSLRVEYRDRIDVRVGFEVDYLPGWEEWTRTELDRVGERTQDGLLSVHFLKASIIDETAEFFMRDVLPKVGGTLSAAYKEYYRTLLAGVHAGLGRYKPRRIGHLNLIRKFQCIHPAPGEFRDEILVIVKAASDKGIQLDMNMSGIRRPNCGEPYIPYWLIEKILSGEIEIECVFGSDAHRAESVGTGLKEISEIVAVKNY